MAALLSLAALPSRALACAVCGVGIEDPTTNVFLVSTIVLSLVPLAMIGGTVFWLVRRSAAARDATATET